MNVKGWPDNTNPAMEHGKRVFKMPDIELTMHLSQTSFVQYLQCPKLFWTAVNAPNQISWLSRQRDRLRQQEERQVEEYAQTLFPDGLKINRFASLDEIVAAKREAVLRPVANKPLFDAVIQAGSLIAEPDILLPLDNGFIDLFAVKSSTDIKPNHLPEIAFQRHVCTQSGLKINRCYLLTLNPDYVRQGDIEPDQIFSRHDITDELNELVEEITCQISSAQEIMGKKQYPEIQIGPHCDNPLECPMRDVCWKNIHDHPNNVFTLTRVPHDEKWGFYNQGIIINADIPADYHLMPEQKIQIECERTGQIHVDKKGVKEFLDRLVYPLCFLDIGTVNMAVPILDGMRPYEQLPFQFSLHTIDTRNEEPYHLDWIWSGLYAEVRLELLTRLEWWLSKSGSIISYNAKREMGILETAMKMNPEFHELPDGVLERFVDMQELFRNFTVYHPRQHGSCSLKAVMQAITGNTYDHLQIQDDEMAGWALRRMLELDLLDDDERKESDGFRSDLEKYYRQNTLGMTRILRQLHKLA